MERCNPYAVAYKHMHMVEQEAIEAAQLSGTTVQTVRMLIKRGSDQRRYNNPTHDEVAAVFDGDDGAPPIPNNITVYPYIINHFAL